MRSLPLVLIMLSSVSAAHAGLPECQDLYQARETLPTAVEALQCYRKLQAETRSTDRVVYRSATEYALQTAIWLYTRSSEDLRVRYADEGLTLAKDALEQLPESGVGPYWLAVFHVMKCRVLDTGAIPTCFMKRKGTIIELLKTARQIEPSVHGYGPSRILGVLYREMPKIVGGDLKLAVVLTSEAVKNAPMFSTNILEHAKTLIRMKDHSAARVRLQTFVNTPCKTLDADRIPECSVEKLEAFEILKKLPSGR